jgi:drug/metabolite transporter (DMT)-like permease
MTDRRAYLLLVLVILFWAGNYPLSKLGLRELGPATITGTRALLTAPAFWLLARWASPLTRPLLARDWIAFVVLGLTGIVANTTVWFVGMAHTTALNAGILGAASPIFVAVAAAVLLGDELSPANYVGIALSVVAVALTVTKGSMHVLMTFSVNRGDLIILASQVAWVAYSIYTRAAASTLPPAWIMAGAHAVGAVVLVPIALAVEQPFPALLHAPTGLAVIVYGALPVTVGHLWYYRVVRAIGPGRAVTFLNLMPFVVIVLSWAIIGEPVHAYHLAAAALVIVGVGLATRR